MGQCETDTLEIYNAGSSIASETTGPSLLSAAEADEGVVASGPTTSTAFAITPMVAAWAAGVVPNDGMILETATESTDTSGFWYPSTSASTGAATITVTYLPPTVPSAPVGVTATAGDGGALVQWSEPANPGAVSLTNGAVSGYQVEAINSVGTVVATTSAGGDYAVMTGLTDGAAYTFAVAATNVVGTGGYADSSAVTPAVLSSSAEYVAASGQFLNGRDALEMGAAPVEQAQTAGDPQAQIVSAALTGDAEAAMVSPMLASQYSVETGIQQQMAASDQTESSDSTTMSNSLAVPGADGDVTVYATGDENFTTVDTSGGTTQDVPGESLENYVFDYSNGALQGYYDADAVFNVVAPGNENADAPALDPAGASLPAALATGDSGEFTAGPADAPAQTSGVAATPNALNPNTNSIANWANTNARNTEVISATHSGRIRRSWRMWTATP